MRNKKDKLPDRCSTKRLLKRSFTITVSFITTANQLNRGINRICEVQMCLKV